MEKILKGTSGFYKKGQMGDVWGAFCRHGANVKSTTANISTPFFFYFPFLSLVPVTPPPSPKKDPIIRNTCLRLGKCFQWQLTQQEAFKVSEKQKWFTIGSSSRVFLNGLPPKPCAKIQQYLTIPHFFPSERQQ